MSSKFCAGTFEAGPGLALLLLLLPLHGIIVLSAMTDHFVNL
jgi:hypothetical protein